MSESGAPGVSDHAPISASAYNRALPSAPDTHPEYGEPLVKYHYFSSDGRLHGRVYTFEHNGAQVRADLSLVDGAWTFSPMLAPVPLWNVLQLAEIADAPVCICDSEAAASAAMELLPSHICLAWTGGFKGVSTTDWGALVGRNVLVWCTAGKAPMASLVPVFNAVKAAKASPIRAIPPDDAPEGWNAEAALSDGWGPEDAEKWLISRGVGAPHVMASDEPEPSATSEQSDAAEPDRAAPFTFLGHDHGTYFYVPSDGGQVVSIAGAGHTKSALMMLAPLYFWETEYMCKGREGWDAAANALIRRSHKIGVYDPWRIRGRGAWWDEGRVVVHLGDRLIIDNQPTPVHAITSRFLYEVQPPIHFAAAAPLTSPQAGEFVALCKMLNWERPISAYLLAGWCALAPICGALKWRPHLWITGTAGSGKAQPHTSPILTPKGWTTMGQMKRGDLVTTPDNGYGRVLAVHPQGVVPVYKITFSDGRSTRASADHLWKVRIGNDWKLRTTAELLLVIGRETRGSRSLAIPLSEPLTINPNEELNLPLPPYVLGAFLGDGHFGNVQGAKKAGQFILTSYDDFIFDKVSSLLPPDLALHGQKRDHVMRLGDLARYGKKTRILIKELRLLGVRSNSKFIPEPYLNSSISERVSLLQGLMDTDGTVGKLGHISFCSVSKIMAHQVARLVRSLGGIARVSEKKSRFTYKGVKKDGQLAYIVSIRFKDGRIAFSLPRKLGRIEALGNQYSDCLYLNIKSIAPDGYEECSCITIDHPDRLYVTDDFTVTHNSWVWENIAVRAASGFGLPFSQSTTEPAIRRSLRCDGRPAFIDEFESKDSRGADRVQAVMDFFRAASSESSAFIAKASSGGSGVDMFRPATMGCFSSIGVAASEYADVTRWSVCGLRAVDKTDAAISAFAALEARQRDLLTPEYVDGLHARMVRLIPTIRHNAEVFAIAGGKILGGRRLGDQIGALLAGAFALHSSNKITPEQAAAWLDAQDWTEEKAQATESDGPLCLARITEHVVGLQGRLGRIDRSLGELVRIAAALLQDDLVSREVAIATIERYGLTIESDMMAVSNTHSAIGAILANTQFARNWNRRLKSLPSAIIPDGPVRFGVGRGAPRTRAVLVPIE